MPLNKRNKPNHLKVYDNISNMKVSLKVNYNKSDICLKHMEWTFVRKRVMIWTLSSKEVDLVVKKENEFHQRIWETNILALFFLKLQVFGIVHNTMIVISGDLWKLLKLFMSQKAPTVFYFFFYKTYLLKSIHQFGFQYNIIWLLFPTLNRMHIFAYLVPNLLHCQI